jgi:hypothetical protein
MSALPPKADIGTQSRNVRFVPKADILRWVTFPPAVFDSQILAINITDFRQATTKFL